MGQKKSKIFFSNAVWSEVGKSSDSHGDFEMAKGVCMSLLWNHGNIPCETRGYCEKVFVTDEEGYLHFEKQREDKFKPSYAQQETLSSIYKGRIMATKLEKIYDEKISPLMTQIIKICKDENIPMVASYQLDWDEERESYLKCSTALLFEPAGEDLRRAKAILYGEGGSSFMAMTISSGK